MISTLIKSIEFATHLFNIVIYAARLFLFLAPTAAHSEAGCPIGFFPSEIDKKCITPLKDSNLPLDDREPMRFEAIQTSLSMIYIQAIGTITKDTPDEFKKFLRTEEAQMSKNMFIHSPGGNLIAGLDLGKLIRQAKIDTYIGRSIPLEGMMSAYDYQSAYCMSSCAYAFMGGITRHFNDNDIFGIHRFGVSQGTISSDDAQVISSIVAKYVESMGVDVSVLGLASLTPFENDMYRVSVNEAKRMRIIFDPTGITSFTVEEHDGLIIASFDLIIRNHSYKGMVACTDGNRLLLLFDTDDAIPYLLRKMKEFPAIFYSGAGNLKASVTYFAASKSNPAYLAFSIPNLTSQAFLGNGIWLADIHNPYLKPKDPKVPVELFIWLDAVDKLGLRISADNAPKTLPIVFRSCRPPAITELCMVS